MRVPILGMAWGLVRARLVLALIGCPQFLMAAPSSIHRSPVRPG
jgi:hypothetical protein